MDIPEDEESCCGLLTIEVGQAVIGIFLVGFTCAVFYMTIYYEHFVFFLPLLLICGLYSIFFVVAKLIPTRDNADSRRVLLFMMFFFTLIFFIYGVLVVNEIFNNVPTEMCNENAFMEKKDCIGWTTGARGNLLVILETIAMLYFTYIHLEHCNQMKVQHPYS